MTDFEQAAKTRKQTGIVAEFWYFLKTQQEVVAAADRRDPAGVRRAGVPVGHGRGAVHLHAVLTSRVTFLRPARPKGGQTGV